MSDSREITRRIERHKTDKPTTALDRSRSFKSLQVTHTKLISWRKECRNTIARATADLADADKQLSEVEAQLTELKKIKGPVVTEHALLRYVEKYMGINLNEVQKEILKLTEDKIVKSGNTIITVFTDPQDHFNLAEREKQ